MARAGVLPPPSWLCASISENTRRAYQSALDRLQAFLREQGQDLAHLTDRQFAEYLGALHEGGSSPASASLACAAVRFLAKTTGQPSPAGPLTGRVLAGIRRQGKDRGRGQVSGIPVVPDRTPPPPSPPTGTRTSRGFGTRGILALMSDCLLRVSEATALQVDHLALEADGTARLAIEHSKTDQEGTGAVLFVGAPTVSRLRAWMRVRRDRVGSAVSPGSPRRGSGWRSALHPGRPADHQAPRRRRRPARAHFSGHSLRVGSTQSLASQGASLVEMQNCRTLAVSGHARPLRPGGVCRPGSRRPAPLREVRDHGSRNDMDLIRGLHEFSVGGLIFLFGLAFLGAIYRIYMKLR